MSNILPDRISLVVSEVMPSDSSHISEIIADRGPARYFHGRTRILQKFNDLLGLAETMKTGRTTILIQGAPGAGKTALLEEMALDALERQWNVVEINLGDLYNPVQIAQTLGKPYVSRKKTATKVDGKLLSKEYTKEVAGDSSVSQVLEKMNPKEGVLLVLDEAQRIAGFLGTSNKIAVMETLDNLHNGKVNRPIILLAAGLGPTSNALRSLGISRFKGGCFVELGALSKESERAVIQDWLVKEGGAKRDPDVWIDAIAQKTHGWPQHISAYGDIAAKQIQNDHGEMSPEGLEIVYKLGTEKREAYYEQRTEEISRKERRSLAKLIKNIAIEDGLDGEDIEEFLSRDFGPDRATDLFNRVVEKGILHRQKGVYTVPIPSMRTWLISNYAHERNSGIGSKEF
ncbi:MAG: ATP-binding protein [Bacteroidetes bacterium]|nr:ATP-binding protein [Bacteroidota bacterium]